MISYQRLQGRADALIRKYGKLRTVTRESGTPTNRAGDLVYDPTTGNMVAPSGSGSGGSCSSSYPKTFQVPMVTFPYEIKFLNNTTIKETDLWGLFSAVALPCTPQPGDKLDMDGVEFTFGPVKPLNPGGVNVYYECHLTQG